MALFCKEIDSPVGKLKLVATDDALVAILWKNDPAGRVRLDRMEVTDVHPVLTRAQSQLGEYFAGQRTDFDLPMRAMGTAFQTKVWEALRKIPYGELMSYGELARTIGFPKASRAVGAANGRNPISIMIPCHRVVGKNGKLTGFAGGLVVKERLLSLEKGQN